ncbi:MAG TPA: hypothetical protein VD859_12930 [Nocardioides sp.]|nr:hypothetical protein [Nocardioides sp.]
MTAAGATVARLGTRLRDRLPPPEELLTWALLAHVAVKLAVLPLVLHAPAYNDEQAYLDGGRALSNLLRDVFASTSPDTAELERNVVASGWFMPGMSVLLAPLFVVVPEAPDWLVRVYLGGASLLVLLWVVRAVRRRLGSSYAALVVLFPGLVPSWVVLSYSAYGDALAGLLLAVLAAHVLAMLRDFRTGRGPGVAEGIQLGLISIAVLYLRSSASTAIVALGLVVLAIGLPLVRGRQRWRTAGVLVLAGLVFAALLAPWSVFASRTLDDRVLTTTSVPVSLANTFGERGPLFSIDDSSPPKTICFGPCDPDSTLWFAPLRYARELSRATGVSEVEASQAMSDWSLRDLTSTDYARQVLHNLGAYTLVPANFAFHLGPEEGHGPAGRVGQFLAAGVTYLLYLPVLVLALSGLLTVQRRSLQAQVLDVVVKLGLGALLVQPFVHVAGSRYWTTAGPFLVLAAAGFVLERMARHREGQRPDERVEPLEVARSSADERLSRWLLRGQLLLARATVAVAVAIPLLAI